ncbi:MAG: type II toxin-antitoxin system VapC family toxin [Candidatus Eremiobacteraeota bacterium]|nr:type II toxin-antitoxin system VapC family toxin [Candidatus Eremiobacteraeota bacterium]
MLLRLLVDDPEEQATRQRVNAARLIDVVDAARDHLFVADVVLCEVVWTLRRTYGVSRASIRETLAALLQTQHLAFEAPDGISRALVAFTKGKGDFADYVIRERAREAGCEYVATFDRALLREEDFRLP